MNQFSFGQIWLLNVFAHRELFLFVNLVYFSLEHHGIEINIRILNLKRLRWYLIIIFLTFFNDFFESIDDLVCSLIALMIKLVVIDRCGELIWIQVLIIKKDSQRRSLMVVIKELLEIAASIIFYHFLEINDNDIVVFHRRGLLIHEIDQVLDYKPSISTHRMSKHVHEIKVHCVN